jgi:hypothetical protein
MTSNTSSGMNPNALEHRKRVREFGFALAIQVLLPKIMRIEQLLRCALPSDQDNLDPNIFDENPCTQRFRNAIILSRIACSTTQDVCASHVRNKPFYTRSSPQFVQ